MTGARREPGSRLALEAAKHNLVHHYLLVGTTERLPEFVAVLEALMPGMFSGASRALEKGTSRWMWRARDGMDMGFRRWRWADSELVSSAVNEFSNGYLCRTPVCDYYFG